MNIVEVVGYAHGAAWLPWAVQYFFLIGLSTAAFFLSLPGIVWRSPRWASISQRALLAALVCGFVAPVALLADLHQPGRFMNFYLYPNPGSWMAWGSFFIPLYMLGLTLYAWLYLRPTLHALGGVYRRLAYGGHENRGALIAAAALAALGAVLILLYTGMETMVVAARALWHSPITPWLLLTTAVTGGLGVTALFEYLAKQRSGVRLLNRGIVLGQALTLLLLAAWLVIAVAGFSAAEAEALAAMKNDSGWGLIGLWLAGSALAALWLAQRAPDAPLLPALISLQGAWATRWVLLMSGQSLPKIGATGHAYVWTLTPDSLLGVLGTFGLCLTLYLVLTGLLPWNETNPAKEPSCA